jgi:hypothetical protein
MKATCHLLLASFPNSKLKGENDDNYLGQLRTRGFSFKVKNGPGQLVTRFYSSIKISW